MLRAGEEILASEPPSILLSSGDLAWPLPFLLPSLFPSLLPSFLLRTLISSELQSRFISS